MVKASSFEDDMQRFESFRSSLYVHFIILYIPLELRLKLSSDCKVCSMYYEGR